MTDRNFSYRAASSKVGIKPPSFQKNEYFINLKIDEHKYFQLIFSFEPLNKLIFEKLQSFYIEVVENPSKKKLPVYLDTNLSLDDLFVKIRLENYHRKLQKFIYEACQENYVFDEEDSNLDCFFTSFEDDLDFRNWKRSIVTLYRQMLLKRNEYIKQNTGLVNVWVNKIRCARNPDISNADLAQEGIFGLIRAIEKFDYEKGWSFSTYAVHWIRHVLTRYLDDFGTPIRFPVHHNTKRMQLAKITKQFYSQHGYWPSREQLMEVSGLDRETLSSLLDIKVSYLEDYGHFSQDDGDKADWQKFVKDENSPDQSELRLKMQLENKIKRSLKTLDPREYRIILERFGFTDSAQEGFTLNEIGKDFNVSRERIRQIEAQALEKLKKVIKKSDYI